MRFAPVLVLAACNGAGSLDFTIDGNVSGAGAPTAGMVIVSWQLSGQTATSTFGQGSATKTAFSVDLANDPPPQAINADGVGVGVFVLAAGGANIGNSADYAVIWRDVSNATPAHPWEANFGARYSCAHCVRGGAGALDSFELTPCANVTIVVPAGTTCTWY